MHADVLDLRRFYYATRLGRVAQRVMRDAMAEYWPRIEGKTVAGFGFPVPLLRPTLGSARRVIALMPSQQGVMAWPPGKPNVSVLAPETAWPLPDGLVDRLVVLHGLETCESPGKLLGECVRVLAPGGRILFIVPNRSGLWARRDATPFGVGRPYSLGQLEALLKRHDLVAERHRAALFMPPRETRFWLRFGPAWERVAARISGQIAGGLLLVEATHDLGGQPPSGLRESVRSPLEVLEGITSGRPEPVRGRVPGQV